MFYFDPLYFMILAPAMVLSIWAAWATRSRFRKYAEVPNSRGLSGAQVARAILDRNGLESVAVEPQQGVLSDHYDPRTRVVRLSPDVYSGRSVSALAVAAHETGHALQHQTKYAPLALRSMTVPLASFGSNFAFILIAVGMMLSALSLAYVGVFLFAGVVLFQFITLPVEFDASKRAKQILFEYGLVSADERQGVARVLNAAAMTYVAAAATSVLTLLYYLIRIGAMGNDRRD